MKLLKNRKVIKLLILICLINLLISFYICFRRRILLKVTKDNKNFIETVLNDYNIDTTSVSRVAYGREWTHGFIYVYHPFRKTESSLISEGEIKKDELAEYIRENGYNEKNTARWLCLTSILIMIFCIIKLKKKM